MTTIGIDVSKGRYDACVHAETQCHRFEGRNAEKQVVKFVSECSEPHVILEATGGYEQRLCELLDAQGVAFSVVNPARARAFMRSVGGLAKTDAIDARLLARMGHALGLAPTTMAKPERRALHELVVRREQLTELVVMQRSQAEHARDARVRASIGRVTKELGKEIRAIEQSIREHVQTSEELREPCRRLQTVPGVGATIAPALLVYLPELGRLTREQAAALAGLAPYNVDSGAHRGSRKIRAGRAPARRMLYMAALVAARRNPVLKPVYERLRAQGKPGKVALIAVARRLVVILNAMLKRTEDWRADTHGTLAA